MGSRKKIVKLPHYKIGKFVEGKVDVWSLVEGEQFLVTCIRNLELVNLIFRLRQKNLQHTSRQSPNYYRVSSVWTATLSLFDEKKEKGKWRPVPEIGVRIPVMKKLECLLELQ